MIPDKWPWCCFCHKEGHKKFECPLIAHAGEKTLRLTRNEKRRETRRENERKKKQIDGKAPSYSKISLSPPSSLPRVTQDPPQVTPPLQPPLDLPTTFDKFASQIVPLPSTSFSQEVPPSNFSPTAQIDSSQVRPFFNAPFAPDVKPLITSPVHVKTEPGTSGVNSTHKSPPREIPDWECGVLIKKEKIAKGDSSPDWVEITDVKKSNGKGVAVWDGIGLRLLISVELH